jgi:hypothetical protein
MAAAAQASNAIDLQSAAGEQCRLVLARKLGLNIGSVTVAETKRLGSWTVLQGSFAGYRPPAPPAPGMAAPLHVIDIKYDYRCWLRQGAVRRVWAHKIGE